jgi:hypothetical protein
MPSLFRSAVPLLALFSAVAHAVYPVVVEGQDFVNTKTNKRLMIVGVDYQIGGEAGCTYIHSSATSMFYCRVHSISMLYNTMAVVLKTLA